MYSTLILSLIPSLNVTLFILKRLHSTYDDGPNRLRRVWILSDVFSFFFINSIINAVRDYQ